MQFTYQQFFFTNTILRTQTHNLSSYIYKHTHTHTHMFLYIIRYFPQQFIHLYIQTHFIIIIRS